MNPHWWSTLDKRDQSFLYMMICILTTNSEAMHFARFWLIYIILCLTHINPLSDRWHPSACSVWYLLNLCQTRICLFLTHKITLCLTYINPLSDTRHPFFWNSQILCQTLTLCLTHDILLSLFDIYQPFVWHIPPSDQIYTNPLFTMCILWLRFLSWTNVSHPIDQYLPILILLKEFLFKPGKRI